MESLYDSVQVSPATKIVLGLSGLTILIVAFKHMATKISNNLKGDEDWEEIDKVIEETFPKEELFCFANYIVVSLFFCCFCISLCLAVDLLHALK